MNKLQAKRTKILKRIAIILVVATGIMLSMTYGKWEILTFLHGKEFDRTYYSEDDIKGEGFRKESPGFIKVINYSQDKADVLWVEGAETGSEPLPSDNRSYYYVHTFKRPKAHPKDKWILDKTYTCTPAHGPPEYYFPFYGGLLDSYN
jgi:hypothetical protein